MTSEMERLDKHRGQVLTRSGPASYVDTGGPGRPVLFVHGVGTSSYLWRNVIGLLDGERRCVAIDLPLHGHTPAAADQDFTLPGLARFVADCCDALGLTDFNMVANDTGGAVTQVFAAGHAERLHTLTLTNCEAHNNVPPSCSEPAVLLAHMGLAARMAYARRGELVRDIPRGQETRLRQRLPGRHQAARRHRARLAGTDVDRGIGPPEPAPDDLAARPRPAGGRTRAGPPAGPHAVVWGTSDGSSAVSGPTGCATPSPAPPRWSRSTGQAVLPRRRPPNSPRPSPALGRHP